MIYDILVDLIKHLSVSLDFLKPYATLLGVIVLLLRQNNIKKIINGHLPKRFRDTQSNDIYDIMRDIKAIKEHLGVVECGDTRTSSNTEARSFKRLRSILSRVILQRKLLLRRKKRMSRKLVIMIFGAIVMTLSQFGITLDPETVIGVGTLLISAILGQSAVDINGVGQYAPLKEKFKSKKLWTALGGSVLLVVSDYYALGISSEVVYWIAGLGATYILGKSAVSVAQASKNEKIQEGEKYH